MPASRVQPCPAVSSGGSQTPAASTAARPVVNGADQACLCCATLRASCMRRASSLRCRARGRPRVADVASPLGFAGPLYSTQHMKTARRRFSTRCPRSINTTHGTCWGQATAAWRSGAPRRARMRTPPSLRHVVVALLELKAPPLQQRTGENSSPSTQPQHALRGCGRRDQLPHHLLPALENSSCSASRAAWSIPSN
jgi:hypothetical protein